MRVFGIPASQHLLGETFTFVPLDRPQSDTVQSIRAGWLTGASPSSLTSPLCTPSSKASCGSSSTTSSRTGRAAELVAADMSAVLRCTSTHNPTSTSWLVPPWTTAAAGVGGFSNSLSCLLVLVKLKKVFRRVSQAFLQPQLENRWFPQCFASDSWRDPGFRKASPARCEESRISSLLPLVQEVIGESLRELDPGNLKAELLGRRDEGLSKYLLATSPLPLLTICG